MSDTSAPRLPHRLLTPRHWPAWLGIGVVWLAARLPYRALLACGTGLGRVIGSVPSTRRRVVQRNLQLCFPDLAAAQRQELLEENLRDLGRMLAEFSLGWMGSERALRRVPCHIEGMQHLAAIRELGRGVLLVGGHFSHLELCARLVSREIRIAGMYRNMDSAVFDWAVLRARLRYADAMFSKEALRASVRYLKRGGILWYAPDQDMRGKDRVFAPFFGIPAATITATHHLARLSGAAVMPFFHRRLPEGGYALRIEPPLEHFPSADIRADTTRVNGLIERMVQESPAQYLWAHKRFKTRPPGEPALYDGDRGPGTGDQ